MKEIPISDAKNSLTSLVHQAEAGKPVRLTRRGKPVAVLLSNTAYCRLEQSKPPQDIWQFVERWRSELPANLHELRFSVAILDTSTRKTQLSVFLW